MSVQQKQPADSIPETFEEEFQVEKILAKKIEDGKVLYLIKWQGFEGQDTWEPESHLLDCPELIRDFEERIRAELQLHVDTEQNLAEIRGQTTIFPQNDLIIEGTHSDTLVSPAGFDRGLEPHKILGATLCEGELCFLIQWKGCDVADIVPSGEANLKCPQVVIKFYQERINWSTTRTLAEILGEEEEEENAEQ